MQSETEIDAELDEPLRRGRPDEDEEQAQDLERQLAHAGRWEFPESAILPGIPLS
jgi:hypothetical protein